MGAIELTSVGSIPSSPPLNWVTCCLATHHEISNYQSHGSFNVMLITPKIQSRSRTKEAVLLCTLYKWVVSIRNKTYDSILNKLLVKGKVCNFYRSYSKFYTM